MRRRLPRPPSGVARGDLHHESGRKRARAREADGLSAAVAQLGRFTRNVGATHNPNLRQHVTSLTSQTHGPAVRPS